MSLALGLLGIAAPGRADEVDDLVRRLAPPARFAGHRPVFSVEKRSYAIEHRSGLRDEAFYIVRDGPRYVAVIPARSGTIHLIDFNPLTAPRELRITTARWLIETSMGTELRTDAYIPSEPAATGATYRFQEGEGTLTLVRRYRGTSTFGKWTHKSEGPVTVDATNTFVFRCDPILGYVVDGTFDDAMKPAPERFEYFSAATAGICNVWAGEEAPSRVVITPTYREGFEGYALNFPAIDRCDNDRAKFRCRDGGFAAFLNEKTGWSPTTTLVGAEARFVVCNAHADLDFVTEWPGGPRPGPGGLTRRVVRTRILALPPEITRYLWRAMHLRFEGMRWVQMRIGRVEDFEDQPLSLTEAVRGLTSTGGGPPLGDRYARSGRKSAVIRGRFWPNLPQVPLEPNTRYLLEAWMKVVPWTAEERAAAEEKERERIEKLRGKGRDVPDFRGFGPPRASITGHLYESSPHEKVWIVQQKTNAARPGGPQWQRVSLEFRTPRWAPFIDIVFIAEACTAYMDDFRLVPAREAEEVAGWLRPSS